MCILIYGCRKSSERMKRVAYRAISPRRPKSFHANEWSIDDRRHRSLNWLPAPHSRRDQRTRSLLPQVAYDEDYAVLSETMEQFHNRESSLNSQRVRRILSPFGSTKWVHALAINLASISDYNLRFSGERVTIIEDTQCRIVDRV